MGRMMYYKLFDYMTRQGMKKSELAYNKVISLPTLAKLRKGESVTTEALCKICDYLNCQPNDIMEYVPDKKEGGKF